MPKINSWSRSINVMHRSTLAVKLIYFRNIKLLLHYLSVQIPLSHVVSASMLSLHTSLWHGDDWVAWCSEQSTGGVPKKALLTLSTARKYEASLVRQHVLKKPASKKHGKRLGKKRVTPLSVTRLCRCEVSAYQVNVSKTCEDSKSLWCVVLLRTCSELEFSMMLWSLDASAGNPDLLDESCRVLGPVVVTF